MISIVGRVRKSFFSQERSPEAPKPRRDRSPMRLIGDKESIPAQKACELGAEQQECIEGVSRRIDWYAKARYFAPPIARFLDTHWRAYIVMKCERRGEFDASCRGCRDAIQTMKNLAWSVRPKKDDVSRRRLISLIPGLHEQLYSGLVFVGVEEREQDEFFVALARLHQEALYPADHNGRKTSRTAKAEAIVVID